MKWQCMHYSSFAGMLSGACLIDGTHKLSVVFVRDSLRKRSPLPRSRLLDAKQLCSEITRLKIHKMLESRYLRACCESFCASRLAPCSRFCTSVVKPQAPLGLQGRALPHTQHSCGDRAAARAKLRCIGRMQRGAANRSQPRCRAPYQSLTLQLSGTSLYCEESFLSRSGLHSCFLQRGLFPGYCIALLVHDCLRPWQHQPI